MEAVWGSEEALNVKYQILITPFVPAYKYGGFKVLAGIQYSGLGLKIADLYPKVWSSVNLLYTLYPLFLVIFW